MMAWNNSYMIKDLYEYVKKNHLIKLHLVDEGDILLACIIHKTNKMVLIHAFVYPQPMT